MYYCDTIEARIMHKALSKLLYEKPNNETVIELDEYRDIDHRGIKRFCDYIMKSDLPFELKKAIVEVLDEPTQYLDEEKAKKLGVNNGMKTSRAIRRVLKGYEIRESEFAKFADAINPYERKMKYSVSVKNINDVHDFINIRIIHNR